MPTPINAVIIDDEKHCIETLRYELQTHCPWVKITGTATSGLAGIKLINDMQPELIFLDIEMRGMNGFEMLQEMGEIKAEVIFVTAFDQYALQAFRCAATDYLLKPVISAQLIEAVNRVTGENSDTTVNKARLEALLYNLRDGIRSPRVALSAGRNIDFVEASKIMYCKAESNYTTVVLMDGKKYTLSKTLGDVETMMDYPDFFRVHQSFLINFGHMVTYMRDDGGMAVMRDGTHVPISKRRKEDFLQRMKVGG